MTFDTPPDRRNTHSSKWDTMESLYGISPDDGLAMWVADMDFEAADPIKKAVQKQVDHGVFGYYGDDRPYLEAIQWWMKERHNWTVDAKEILTVHGLVNGTALCVDALSKPGDGIVLFTPVYHAFARVINAAERHVVECELDFVNGRYEMNFERYDAQMTGSERMLFLCSPHNPGGRVWSKTELQAVAAFAKRHELIIVSDEIHHDLTLDGHIHTPMTHIDGIEDRLVMMTSAGKTFNIAAGHTGQVIVPDPDLRARIKARMNALGISPNSFGLFMTTAAYSPEGAFWVDQLRSYISENKAMFDKAINAIPGLNSMPLEATYLAWVGFENTGLTPQDVQTRLRDDAKIAANVGKTFGAGGELYTRFNLAAPRHIITDAIGRLQHAFSDLQ